MKHKKILTLTAITIAAGLGVFFIRFAPQAVKAFNPQPDPPGFGIFGISEGQSIRFSVVNTNLNPPPEPDLPPPCRVVMTLRDSIGNAILRPNGTPVHRVVELGLGESTSLAFNGDNLPRGSDGMVRPDVKIQQADPVDGQIPPPCIPSAEVITNANGRTQFMVPFVFSVQPVRGTN
jgi:hypothetical protein